MRVTGTLDIDGQTIKLDQGATESTTITSNSPAAATTITLPNATATLITTALAETLTNKTLTAPDINAGTVDNITSLGLRDTSAAYDVVIGATSSTNLSANRAFTLDVINAARSMKMAGNIDIAGNITTTGALITSGAYSLTLTQTATTNVTLPTTGTLSTLAGSETLTNKTLTSPILTTPTMTAGSDLTLSAQAELRLEDAAGGEYMGLVAPTTISSTYTLEIPAAAPTANSQAWCVTDYTADPVTMEWATIVATLATQNLFIGDGSADPAATDTSSVGDILADSTNGLTLKSGATLILPQIEDTSADHQYIFAVNELVADRTVTLPLLTANDEFIFANHIATLTGKNIGDPSDNTKDIAFTLSGATTAKTMTIISAHSDDRSLTLPNATDTLVGKATTDTLTNKTIGDTNTINAQDDAFTIDDASDATKQIDFDAAGTTSTKTTITSSQTGNVTITLPDATDTLIGKATTDTLTNKTFDANGTGNSISNVDLTADITGVLPILDGGTGQTTALAGFDALQPMGAGGDIIYGGASGTGTVLTNGAAGQVLTSAGGTAAPTWGAGGGSSGEINYIDNFGFEDTTTTGWAGFDDGAVSVPVDGTTTTPSLLTLSAQTGTILRDNQSMKIAKATGDAQGQGFSYDFTTKAQDSSKKLKIQFDFKTDEDAAYDSGHWGVWIYDVTNSTLITPVDTSIISGQNIFQTSFNSTTSTSYRLILMATTTENTAYDIYFDNFIVGPGMTSQGAAISAWEAFTPTTSWTTNTTTTAYKRRVGSDMEISIFWETSGAPDTADLSLTIPDGLTIDTGAIGSGTNSDRPAQFGVTTVTESGVAVYQGRVQYNSTTLVKFQVLGAAGTYVIGTSTVNQATPHTWGTGDSLAAKIIVPIAEWAGKGIVPMLAEDNLSEWTAFTPSLSTGAFGTNANSTFLYRRVGDSMEVFFSLIQSGAGTAGSGVYEIAIPEGKTISSAITTYNQAETSLGSVHMNSGGTDYYGYVTCNTSDGFSIRVDNAGTETTWGSSLFPLSTATTRCSTIFTVPIAEWAGSQNSLVGYSLYNPGVQTGLVDSRGILGVTDGSTAATGYVGEYVDRGNTSDVPIASSSVINVDSFSLPAGDWEVSGWVNFKGDTNPTTIDLMQCGLSTTTASMGSNPVGIVQTTGTSIGNIDRSAIGMWVKERFNVSSATTIYLAARCFIISGTGDFVGRITYTRIR